ncbi:MAG: hypothetical protein K0S37_2613 [Microbacterium sp.]|jgi:hypothetical protein|nr:hypothetical protein [Microbacterium sp.]
MPDWLADNIGTVLTVGGSVLVAIIAGAFALWAKHHTPRQPVPIQDVWSENRSLRADLLGVEQRLEVLDGNYRSVLDGISVLWRYVERIKVAWGVQPDMPTLTAAEHRTLARVIEDIDTPAAGTPAAPQT